MTVSLQSHIYLEEFYKLNFNNKQNLTDNELGFNQIGYFIFDVRHIDSYTSTLHMANNLYKSKKFHLFGSYSYVYVALETLIENNLHYQINMLDIEITEWDSINISWKLISKFINIKLLYIDGCNAPLYNKSIPDITAHLPQSLEALYIVNMPYYNIHFCNLLAHSNLKVLILFALKFNQELGILPQFLETLIIASGEFNQKIENLPNSIKHLILLCPKFTMPLEYIPHTLEYFAGLLFNCFIYPESAYNLELINFPSSIKSILLDKNLYDKHYNILEKIYNNCYIGYYKDLNNFEFIFNNLLAYIK